MSKEREMREEKVKEEKGGNSYRSESKGIGRQGEESNCLFVRKMRQRRIRGRGERG